MDNQDEFFANKWFENGDYDSTDCSHCGRERVMKVDAPDGSERRVCEKCCWDQEANEYAQGLEFPSPPHKEQSDAE